MVLYGIFYRTLGVFIEGLAPSQTTYFWGGFRNYAIFNRDPVNEFLRDIRLAPLWYLLDWTQWSETLRLSYIVKILDFLPVNEKLRTGRAAYYYLTFLFTDYLHRPNSLSPPSKFITTVQIDYLHRPVSPDR